MPIRHCQKCGLKVLIDESQAGANPFYCQRCTTAMKQGDPAPSADPVGMAKTPPPAPSAAARPATVKVLCPYCKASFNGRVPQKPARGACPVCQKELILLPTGDIRPAAGFDIAKWQDELKRKPSEPLPAPVATPAPEKESGTKLLIKKFSAQTAASRADTGTRVLSPKPDPEPEPAPVTVQADPEPPAEESTALPSWLDDRPAREAVATEEPAAEPEEEPVQAEASPAEELEPAPVEDEPQEDLLKNVQEIPQPQRAAPRPPAAVIPPPEEPEPPALPPAPAAARKPSTLRRTGDRRSGYESAAAADPTTGLGKVLLAYLFLILPVVACPLLHGQRDKFKGGPLEKAGIRLQKGFLALYQKLAPPPPAPPPAPPPKPEAPPEEKPKPTAEDETRDRDEILRLWGEYKREDRTYKQRLVGASDAEKASEEFRTAEANVKQKEERIRVLRENFKKIYGKDLDPTKE